MSNTRPYEFIDWACEGPDVAKGKAREGIIAHNSVHASNKAGKKVLYEDDCPKEQTKPTT